MKYQIRPFSSYDNWTFKSDTDNVSYIVDKLVRLSAKCTDYFAGDIYYTIRKLNLSVQGRLPLDTLLAFRHGGVNEYTMDLPSEIDKGDGFYLPNCVQLWRLTHRPDITTTVLTRVVASGNNHYVGSDT